MIATRDVGVWAGSVPSVGTGQDEFWSLLRLCDQVLRPFEAEDLLDAKSLVVDDWRDNGIPTKELGGEVTIRRLPGESIEAACRRHFVEHSLGATISAELVTIDGATSIREADGTSVSVVGAISIQGMLTGASTVWIRTRSDAWLPSGLLGEEQGDRYALNAPRLRRALHQASAVLGGMLSPEASKIALVKGFEIENLPVELVRALIDS
jgi:hypothetical protein